MPCGKPCKFGKKKGRTHVERRRLEALVDLIGPRVGDGFGVFRGTALGVVVELLIEFEVRKQALRGRSTETEGGGAYQFTDDVEPGTQEEEVRLLMRFGKNWGKVLTRRTGRIRSRRVLTILRSPVNTMLIDGAANSPCRRSGLPSL